MNIGRTNSVLTGTTIDKIYPIGSIYISANNIDPTFVFGGVWEQIKDVFLLSDGDVYVGGNEGGNATHTHSTNSHTLTIAEMPSHTHTPNSHKHHVDAKFSSGSGGTYDAYLYNGTSVKQVTRYTEYTTATNQNTGGGGSHSHGDTGSASSLPPYLVVYMWKRTE